VCSSDLILFQEKNPNAYYYRALCYQALNKYEEAQKEFAIAIETKLKEKNQ
jgi:tetratricopeptide (TPR) repeat protein